MEPEFVVKRVWSQSVTKIAKESGISGVTIAKVCRRLSIPLPGRGYWAQNSHGHEASRKPLPELKKAIVVARNPPTLTPKPTSAPALHPADQAEFERIDKLAAEAAFAYAPTNKIHRHPLIVATRNAPRNAKRKL